MDRRFFRARQVRSPAGAPAIVLLLLSACFFLGALVGHTLARGVGTAPDGAVQAYLAWLFAAVERREISAPSIGAIWLSYCKYPFLICLFGSTVLGFLLVPGLLFYQGLSFSFAVSAVLAAAPEGGLASAWLLFGLRCGIVLPCCFWLAQGTAAFADFAGRREQRSARNTAVCLVLCVLLLSAGAFLEHIFLPELLYAIVPHGE